MASYDPSTRSVIVRILYDGLGLAGKTRSLRHVREAFSSRSGRLYVPEENAHGRTLFFDWLELDAGRILFERERGLADYALRVELVTVPGQSVYVQRRWSLLRSADAVIAVVDSTPAGLRRGAHGVRFLRAAFEQLGLPVPPLVVQANKQDLAGAARAESVRAQLELEPELDIVEASALTGMGIRETLLKAIKHARGSVQAQLEGRAPSTLPRAEGDPERLYRRMVAVESERGDRLEGELLADRLLSA